MASNDPTDTGGLFIGRRPGTAPIRYPQIPADSAAGRRQTDKWLAHGLLTLELVVCLSLWGPQPLFWIWFGSHAQYWTGSVSAGIVAAFIGMLCSLFASLAAARRLDHGWRLVRRAAGYRQERGVLERIFIITAAIVAVGFLFWFLVLHGPGSSLFSPRAP